MPPPGLPEGTNEKKSECLWVIQLFSGDGLTLGKNLGRDVPTVGVVLCGEGLTLARGGGWYTKKLNLTLYHWPILGLKLAIV